MQHSFSILQKPLGHEQNMDHHALDLPSTHLRGQKYCVRVGPGNGHADRQAQALIQQRTMQNYLLTRDTFYHKFKYVPSQDNRKFITKSENKIKLLTVCPWSPINVLATYKSFTQPTSQPSAPFCCYSSYVTKRYFKNIIQTKVICEAPEWPPVAVVWKSPRTGQRPAEHPSSCRRGWSPSGSHPFQS